MYRTTALWLIASLYAINSSKTIASYESSDKVVILTQDNFEKEVLQSDAYWLVEFYAPWCGHCKKLEPEFKVAAKELESKAKFGAVDCTVHETLCKDTYKIRGYPSLREFGIDKREPKAYKGGRSKDDLIQYIESSEEAQKLGIGSKETESKDEVRQEEKETAEEQQIEEEDFNKRYLTAKTLLDCVGRYYYDSHGNLCVFFMEENNKLRDELVEYYRWHELYHRRNRYIFYHPHESELELYHDIAKTLDVEKNTANVIVLKFQLPLIQQGKRMRYRAVQMNLETKEPMIKFLDSLVDGTAIDDWGIVTREQLTNLMTLREEPKEAEENVVEETTMEESSQSSDDSDVKEVENIQETVVENNIEHEEL